MTDEEFDARCARLGERCQRLVECIDAAWSEQDTTEIWLGSNEQMMLQEMLHEANTQRRRVVLDTIWHWYGAINDAWLRWLRLRRPPVRAAQLAEDARAVAAAASAHLEKRRKTCR